MCQMHAIAADAASCGSCQAALQSEYDSATHLCSWGVQPTGCPAASNWKSSLVLSSRSAPAACRAARRRCASPCSALMSSATCPTFVRQQASVVQIN